MLLLTDGDTHLRRGQAYTDTDSLCSFLPHLLISFIPLPCLPLPFSTYILHFALSHPSAELQPKMSSLSSANVGVKLVSQFNWRPRYALQCISLELLIPSSIFLHNWIRCGYLLPLAYLPSCLSVYLEGGARLLGQKFTHLAHLFLKRAETDSASARSYQMVIFTVINFH